jgi:hypothetical protein
VNDQENDMNSKSSLASRQGRGNRLRRGGGIVAILACLAASAAACGGPGGSANPGAGNGTQASGVAFALCMRAHGVSRFPDPSGGVVNLSGINQNSPQYQHAAGICGRPAGADPSQQAQGMVKGLAFARCMRANGVPDYSDPTANGQGGITSHVSRGSGGPSDKSPVFQRAERACRSVLPGGGNSGSGSGSAG